MSISREELDRIAALSGLAIEASDVAAVTDDISAILEFVRTIQSAAAELRIDAFRPGPAAAPLRPDEPRPSDLAGSIEAFAPDFRDGFFLAPTPPGVDKG